MGRYPGATTLNVASIGGLIIRNEVWFRRLSNWKRWVQLFIWQRLTWRMKNSFPPSWQRMSARHGRPVGVSLVPAASCKTIFSYYA